MVPCAPRRPGASKNSGRWHRSRSCTILYARQRSVTSWQGGSALAMKTAYGCEGPSFRQHNEPAGYQEVWHYHLHVFPRYHGDDLYMRSKERRWVTPAERAPYAEKLRAVLGSAGRNSRLAES